MSELGFIFSAHQVLPHLLKGASEEYSVDTFIKDKTLVYQNSASDFDVIDHRFLEQNLSDVGTLLDRIFAIRRDINDLEANRLKTGLAYLAGIDTAEADHALEIAKSNANNDIKAAADVKRDALVKAVKALEARHSIPGGATELL